MIEEIGAGCLPVGVGVIFFAIFVTVVAILNLMHPDPLWENKPDKVWKSHILGTALWNLNNTNQYKFNNIVGEEVRIKGKTRAFISNHVLFNAPLKAFFSGNNTRIACKFTNNNDLLKFDPGDKIIVEGIIYLAQHFYKNNNSPTVYLDECKLINKY